MACGAAPSTTGGGQERKTGEKRERARARRDRHDFSGALPSPAGRFSSSSVLSRDARDRRRSTCCATSWSVPAERHFLRVAGGASERPCSTVFVSSSVGSGIGGRAAALAARRGRRGCRPLSSRRRAWDHHARRGVAAFDQARRGAQDGRMLRSVTTLWHMCRQQRGSAGDPETWSLAGPVLLMSGSRYVS